MTKNTLEVYNLTETIQAKLTTVSDTLEDLHYDPEVCGERELQDLKELLGFLASAEDLAYELTERLALGAC